MPFPFLDPRLIYGNDLPSQGGITGNIPFGQDTLPPTFPGFDVPMNPQPDFSMPSVYGGVIPPDPMQDLRMQQLFTPEHAAQDRVNQLLGQIPQRENPSFMRRLSSSLVAGGGDYRESQRILNEPYDQKYGDWENQFKPAVQSANLERYSNATERQAAQNQMQFETQGRRISEYEAHNRANEQRDQEKLEIQRKRAEAYSFKQTHPNWKAVPSKGGTVVFVNPTDPTQQIDTGIPTGTMTDYDKINLLQEGRMEQIDAQQAGANQRNANTVEGAADRQIAGKWQPMQIDGKWYDYNTTTHEKHPISGENNQPATNMSKVGTPGRGGGLESQYQIKQGRINRAVLFKNEHPELADYIHTDNGEVIIDAPSSGGYFSSGPDADKYKLMHDSIFGPEMGRSNSVGSSTTPNQGPPAGWMYMTGPDGRVKVPANKIEWAKKNGYK